MLGRSTQRRLVIAGLAGLLAAPAFLIAPASAAILFTCDSVTGSGTLSPGLVRNQRAQSLSSGPTAPAGPADLTLASTSDAGVKGNGGSGSPNLSTDGSRVAFSSDATNLDPADTDSVSDVFVKNFTTGDITLASTSDTGVKGNDLSHSPSLAADGTHVAFASISTNLDPADTEGDNDVYVKDIGSGDIALASTSDTGVKGNSDSYDASLSVDGSRVAFYSEATNLDPADTDISGDVYVKDLTTGDITLATTSDTGVKANGASGGASLSSDGTRVAFSSIATNLDPADTEADFDVYVKDLTTGDVTLATTSDTGVKANNGGGDLSLSGDGTKIAFYSAATNLDPADTDNDADVFVKNLATGDIVLASTSDAGVKGNKGGGITPSLAADGTKVAFTSFATNLDPNQTDPPQLRLDLFVKNLTSGDITLAQEDISAPSSLSADGTHVAFETFAALAPGDADNLSDVYRKQLPATPTSIAIGNCSNSQSGTAAVVELRSYGARPLGCPVSLGGRPGSDYPDQTPVLLGPNPSLRIDWATGPDSFGVGKLKMGTTGTQWRAVLVIQASPGHNTPATNQYLPASGSGFTKTKLKGRVDWSALDSFNCAGGTADPISWLDLVNNGSWIVKNA
jgi:hypothetical protein